MSQCRLPQKGNPYSHYDINANGPLIRNTAGNNFFQMFSIDLLVDLGAVRGQLSANRDPLVGHHWTVDTFFIVYGVLNWNGRQFFSVDFLKFLHDLSTYAAHLSIPCLNFTPIKKYTLQSAQPPSSWVYKRRE